MNTTLNDLAMETVGLPTSLFFVTIVTDTEFDGAPSTIAAFVSLMDAAKFASSLRANANETIIVEGPDGIYLDSSVRPIAMLRERVLAQIKREDKVRPS